MRKATYRIPAQSGDKEDAEMAVFYFGPREGGGIEANIERWVQQFSGVPSNGVHRDEEDVNGLRVHLVDIDKGTFNSGMPGSSGPKTDYALLGAIVEAPSGAYFFKATGPSATIHSARSAFRTLIKSVKPAS